MSYELVDVHVRDTTTAKNPIEGVMVAVYSVDGSLFYTRSETDAAGMVGFNLSTQTYSLRFFKQHVGFSQPQLVSIIQEKSNVFDVYGEVFIHPIAPDPRLCRVSGHFLTSTGAPNKYLDMHVAAIFSPILLEGDGVVCEEQLIRTDDKGFVQVDLIRFGEYCVMVQGIENERRVVCVPDLASANLPDLLFPRVATTTFEPDGPFALYVGQTVKVETKVLTQGGQQLSGTAIGDVLWTSSDPAVASLQLTSTDISIRGNAPGTAAIQATRVDSSIISIPDNDIEVVNGGITVY